jgi:hypothetical protein
LEALTKWRKKIYNDIGSKYHGVVFYEIIKDIDYVRSIDICKIKKEHHRLVEYAKAVWFYKPPPPPPHIRSLLEYNPTPPGCEKCVEQKAKGFKNCYGCFTKKNVKNVKRVKTDCKWCDAAVIKGYIHCFVCNEKFKTTY